MLRSMVVIPEPVLETPAEDFAMPWGERECVELAERPGTAAFRDFILKHVGGRDGGVGGRPCMSTGHQSGHYSARAWDWMVRADNPEERERAEGVLDWLLKNNAENFRRVGLTYVIWNKKRWSPRTGGWVNYGGFDDAGNCSSPPCRHPHHDHVHFSFGKPGADGKTSFFRWLKESSPDIDIPKHPKPAPGPSRSTASTVLALAAGAALGAVVVRQIPRLAAKMPRRP